MNLLRVISIVLALALGASACDDDTTSTTSETTGTTAPEPGDAGDEGENGDVQDGDEGDDGTPAGGAAAGVELPDPCEVLRGADQAELEAVVGPISGYDGPDDDLDGSFPSRICAALGERFKAQLQVQPAATSWSPGSYNNENEVSGIGDQAFTFTVDEDADADRTLVFKDGDLTGWVNLLFAGGSLTEAPEPTEEDVIAVGRAVATTLANV